MGEHVKYLAKNQGYVKVVSIASPFERNQTIFYPYWGCLFCQISSGAVLELVCPHAVHCLTCFTAIIEQTKQSQKERESSQIFFSPFKNVVLQDILFSHCFIFQWALSEVLGGQGFVLEESWNGSCEKIFPCKVKWRIWAFCQFCVGMMISRQFAMSFCIIF